MDKFTIDELKDVVSGEIIQKGEVSYITGVSIDSRRVMKGDLYIPIIGENMDGHQFINGAVDNGAEAVLIEHDIELPSGITVIKVTSTKTALQAIGEANRKRYDIPVVAVTGSSGKTTTKDVIASVLAQRFKTMKTQGNYNNQLGVPQTLFQLDSTYEAAVVEMGMDHLGDIRETICEVMPHYAVITNIGTAHLEFLKTRENILKAKMEVLETMGENDLAILNGDDPYLNTISDTPYKVIRVGIDNDTLDYRAEEIQSTSDGIHFKLNDETYHFPFPGIHNVYNAMSAIVIAKDLGLTPAEIQDGFTHFVPSGNRMKIATVHDITYIDDSYNANPDAMRAAINVLMDMGIDAKHRIAVLGDMLEMGDDGWKLHLGVGEYAGERVDQLIAVGELGRAYAEGAAQYLASDCIHYCVDAKAAGEKIKKVAKQGDIVLIKASHGVHLERIMGMIQGE